MNNSSNQLLNNNSNSNYHKIFQKIPKLIIIWKTIKSKKFRIKMNNKKRIIKK